MTQPPSFVRNIVEKKCTSCHGAGTRTVHNASGQNEITTCRACGGTGKAPVVCGSLDDQTTDLMKG